jgi:glycosyltransferase involved in cell wall biosynthesis
MNPSFDATGVSVVIPTYNRAGFVPEAIESVLSQSYRNFEVIVVDDGSTDNTSEVLEPYHDRIRLIQQTNSGVSSARNRGLNEAEGEWVAFLDSDDLWRPDKLAIQTAAAQANPDMVLHTVNVAVPIEEHAADTSFGHAGVSLAKPEGLIGSPLESILSHRTLAMAQGVMCRKDVVELIGGFDETLSIYEDLDLMCRMALQGPWGYHWDVLVDMIRRNEETQNLSESRYIHKETSGYALEKMYSKLLNQNSLCDAERQTVKGLRAENLMMLGMELLRQKQRGSAGEIFRKLERCQSSWKSMVGLTLSKLPSFLSKPLVDYRLNKRKC